MTTKTLIEKENVVVRFVGDSGDGMQLTGTLFSDTSALDGNDIATFPDYPAEIRAPHNTVAGVSGFQVHIGKRIYNSGDKCDVLVAMNPASLISNLKWVKIGGVIIVDADTFTDDALKKAGYPSNPLNDDSLSSYILIKAPITSMTAEAVKEIFTDKKSAERSRNMFALGMLFFIYSKELDHTDSYLEKKFKKNPDVVRANKAVVRAGYNYCENTDVLPQHKVHVKQAQMPKGTYRNITGNIATAWGLLAAAEKAKLPLFLGSYPITPATDILIELSKHKELGARVFQAEDEIAGICSAIGASFAGAMACTSTSGPGLSLKSEAIGLAVMTELPLVIVDVQRGGPSTGLPTKTEQSDLYQALFGRNGEAPCIVIAASTSANSFYFAYEAARLSLEHMTPTILLTDGYLGNGSQLFRIPKMAELPTITPPLAKPNDETYQPYKRDPETLVRQWAIPGMEGLRHRIGGLEKSDGKGNVSTDSANHQLMVNYRAEKVQRVANHIPDQEVLGDKDADLLVVGWGGTEGALKLAVEELREEGKKIAFTQFNYIMPLPKNTGSIMNRYKKIVVCELNMGQFVNYLRMNFQTIAFQQYNKTQGLPFEVSELKEKFNQILGE
ncbi:MAG: 2-oxoacid:acceptor oxidoreductase subunit alpha [Bacteroidales bacterium]|jgi:2-oxoglutarate ferredoxin oxidoreductase subunit alpha|nr:2-oxoacid:acceptor oxidoreductase subunit alpha [Bacteroidales bacterium]MDD4528957.1 2-oxoacid:acceptor oxidoreductase subunit alpha [Bacteroidales bacterium]MDD4830159.1 2-oxoacid:acceptor oxidoreductase subunit alpha [Bacteroidales bacterium]